MFQGCTSFTQPVETWENWKGKFDEETLEMIRSNRKKLVNNVNTYRVLLQKDEAKLDKHYTNDDGTVNHGQYTDPKRGVLRDEGITGHITGFFGGNKKTKRNKKRSTRTHKKTKRSKKQGKTTHKKTKRNKKRGKATHKKRRTKEKR